MALKLPVVNITVSMNEIPDHIAIAIELGNCNRRCKGCHSEWCRTKLPYSQWMDMEVLMAKVNYLVKKGADAIVLMGGTTNGIPVDDLTKAINILSTYAPVGLYSGASFNSNVHSYLKREAKLRWLKTGNFIQERGGLDNPMTNQQFFIKTEKGWLDITSVFQRKE